MSQHLLRNPTGRWSTETMSLKFWSQRTAPWYGSTTPSSGRAVLILSETLLCVHTHFRRCVDGIKLKSRSGSNQSFPWSQRQTLVVLFSTVQTMFFEKSFRMRVRHSTGILGCVHCDGLCYPGIDYVCDTVHCLQIQSVWCTVIMDEGLILGPGSYL